MKYQNIAHSVNKRIEITSSSSRISASREQGMKIAKEFMKKYPKMIAELSK